MSETWFAENMFCPCCGNFPLLHVKNNKPVLDFTCERCGETFELKSKNGKIGNKIADGAYATMMSRINSNNNPSLFVLSYQSLAAHNLLLIPKYFFTPSVIEKRKPLSPAARRAGWTGCNILFNEFPERCKIHIIQNGNIIAKDKVLASYQSACALQSKNIENRGWLLDILKCVEAMPEKRFKLSDLYEFSDYLSELHPNNHNIEAKIRQQLQVLRDKSVITFLGNGFYEKI